MLRDLVSSQYFLRQEPRCVSRILGLLVRSACPLPLGAPWTRALETHWHVLQPCAPCAYCLRPWCPSPRKEGVCHSLVAVPAVTWLVAKAACTGRTIRTTQPDKELAPAGLFSQPLGSPFALPGCEEEAVPCCTLSGWATAVVLLAARQDCLSAAKRGTPAVDWGVSYRCRMLKCKLRAGGGAGVSLGANVGHSMWYLRMVLGPQGFSDFRKWRERV